MNYRLNYRLNYSIVDNLRRKKEKFESFKLESQKLERFSLSWKEPSKLGKNQAKLEISSEVGKYR